MPDPLDVQVAFGLTLDTEIGRWKTRQVGEEEWTNQPMTLLDAVVERMAQLGLDQLVRDATEWQLRRDNTRHMIEKMLREKLEPMIDTAINVSFQKTNNFGEPVGATTSLREMVMTEVQRHLTRSNSRDSYNQTAFDKAIITITGDAVLNELRKEIEAAKVEVRAAMSDTLKNAIASRLAAELVK